MGYKWTLSKLVKRSRPKQTSVLLPFPRSVPVEFSKIGTYRPLSQNITTVLIRSGLTCGIGCPLSLSLCENATQMSGVDDASITGSTTFATPIASNSINFCCISSWIVSVCFSLRKSVLAEWRRNPESRLFLCSVYAGGRVPTPRFWGRWGVKHLKFAKFPPHSVLL